MDSCGLHLPPDAVTASLTIAEQQKVEILRALARQARVIVMDEPTSSLTKDEVDQLHRIMRALRDEGRSVIYVTHFLSDVLEVTDRVTVLRNGALVHTRDTQGETRAAWCRQCWAAKRPKPSIRRRTGSAAMSSCQCAICVRPTARGWTGWRSGQAKWLGDRPCRRGRTEIARAIIGADPAIGTVSVAGRDLTTRSISAATGAGIVMVPEDRRVQGLVLTLPVRANISLPHLGALASWGRLAVGGERGLAQRLIDRFDVRPARVDGDIANFSGGNQQKVLIGKWLAGDPRVVILDEPSRGVDVSARETIHREIARLAAEGKAVLVISSEIDEVLGLATRAFLVDRGRLVEAIDPDQVTEAEVLAALFRHQGQGTAPHDPRAQTLKFLQTYAVLIPDRLSDDRLVDPVRQFPDPAQPAEHPQSERTAGDHGLCDDAGHHRGRFDLSAGAIFGMGSVASAWLALTVHPVVGLAVAPFVGLALGYANGLVINLAARPFLSGDHRHRADLQRHCHRRVERSADFRADRCLHLAGPGKVLGVFNAVWLMVIFALLLTFLLDRTTFGRRVLSVGGNEQGGDPVGHPHRPGQDRDVRDHGVCGGPCVDHHHLARALGQASAGAGLELQTIAAVIWAAPASMAGKARSGGHWRAYSCWRW